MKTVKQGKRARPAHAAGFDPAQAVRNALPGIVNKLIEQAEDGSYQHAKFLFEFAGIAGVPPAAAPEEESLAALLFRELQLEEP